MNVMPNYLSPTPYPLSPVPVVWRLPTQSSLTYQRAGRDGWVVNPR